MTQIKAQNLHDFVYMRRQRRNGKGEYHTNSMLEVWATVCLRKQVPMTVAGRCEKLTGSEIIAAKYQALETKYL